MTTTAPSNKAARHWPSLALFVAVALLMSLMESLLILPSHMGHSLVKRDRLREARDSNSGGSDAPAPSR